MGVGTYKATRVAILLGTAQAVPAPGRLSILSLRYRVLAARKVGFDLFDTSDMTNNVPR